MKVYPEPERHGITSAYGFYIRHANDVDMHDIKITAMSQDLRPAFVIDSVSGVDLRNIKATHATNVPTFSLKNVKNLALVKARELLIQKLRRS